VPTLKDHVRRLNVIAHVDVCEDLAEVKSILDEFRYKNSHPQYGRDASVARAIFDVSRAFRELSKCDGSTVYASKRRETIALEAVKRLEQFIASNGDSIMCPGWAACERRWGKLSRQR
jgi:hypothetical protein